MGSGTMGQTVSSVGGSLPDPHQPDSARPPGVVTRRNSTALWRCLVVKMLHRVAETGAQTRPARELRATRGVGRRFRPRKTGWQRSARRAGDNEQVPNGVEMIGSVVKNQEYRSRRVTEPANQHPPQRDGGSLIHQRRAGEDWHPAQQDVAGYRNRLNTMRKENLAAQIRLTRRPTSDPRTTATSPVRRKAKANGV